MIDIKRLLEFFQPVLEGGTISISAKTYARLYSTYDGSSEFSALVSKLRRLQKRAKTLYTDVAGGTVLDPERPGFVYPVDYQSIEEYIQKIKRKWIPDMREEDDADLTQMIDYFEEKLDNAPRLVQIPYNRWGKINLMLNMLTIPNKRRLLRDDEESEEDALLRITIETEDVIDELIDKTWYKKHIENHRKVLLDIMESKEEKDREEEYELGEDLYANDASKDLLENFRINVDRRELYDIAKDTLRLKTEFLWLIKNTHYFTFDEGERIYKKHLRSTGEIIEDVTPQKKRIREFVQAMDDAREKMYDGEEGDSNADILEGILAILEDITDDQPQEAINKFLKELVNFTHPRKNIMLAKILDFDTLIKDLKRMVPPLVFPFNFFDSMQNTESYSWAWVFD